MYRPRTKHIVVKYHHFSEHVKRGFMSIKPIDTRDKIADRFKKGLQSGTFKHPRYKLLGW